jgi:hypothetical protein
VHLLWKDKVSLFKSICLHSICCLGTKTSNGVGWIFEIRKLESKMAPNESGFGVVNLDFRFH